MNIPHVKLLHGSHSDTGTTGTGCFMNVISYLNGDPTITDKSYCVCYVMRPLAIWANDWMNDAERPALLPFILRAMGSRTDDRAEISRRLALVVKFANKQRKFSAKHAAKSTKCAEYVAKYAEYATEAAAYAAKHAAKSTKCAECVAKYAEYVAKYAAKSTKYAEYAEYAAYAAKDAAAYAAAYAAKDAQYRAHNVAAIIALFDAAFPPLTGVDTITVQRVRTLESLTA